MSTPLRWHGFPHPRKKGPDTFKNKQKKEINQKEVKKEEAHKKRVEKRGSFFKAAWVDRVPAKSRDIPPKKFAFPGFEGHTELFGPHPLTWKTPTPPEKKKNPDSKV